MFVFSEMSELELLGSLTLLSIEDSASFVCRFMLFWHFHSWSGPSDLNKLRILSQAVVTATVQPSAVSFNVSTQQKLIWKVGTFKMFAYGINCDFECVYRQRDRDQSCTVLLRIARNRPETVITCVFD